MSLQIEFSPHEEARIASAARAEGVAPVSVVKLLVGEHLAAPQSAPPSALPDAESQALLNLLQSWRVEDATGDVEELERRDTETEAFLGQLETNRLRLAF